MKLRWIFYFGLLCFALPSGGQESSTLTYQVEAEGDFTSGANVPYYFASNRFGVVEPNANAAYLRGQLEYAYQVKYWNFKVGMDVIGSTCSKEYYANNSHIQQLYGEISYKKLSLAMGQWEDKQMLVNPRLSSGNMVWSNNARPIPQIKVGTHDFVSVPGTGGWVNFWFDMAFGHQTDGGYNKKICGMVTGEKRSFAVVDNPYFHRKNFFLRTKSDELFVATVGIEHVAQYGGKIDGKKQPDGLRDAANVFFVKAKNGEFYYAHLGSFDFKVDVNLKVGSLSGYTQLFFDDKPLDGSVRQSGSDGLWGLEWKMKRQGWINDIVAEYVTTCNQGGRVYTNEVYVGNGKQYHYDCLTYYDDQNFGAYTNYGMNIGSPLLTSPIYNESHWPRPANTIVKAFHLAAQGDISKNFSYRAKFSYRKTWGTTVFLLPEAISNNSGMLEITYHKKGFEVTPSFGFDSGKIFGNNVGFMLNIRKKGIL